ncbi:putative protein phosphatase 2C 23 [Nymphaea thermarum]|nr:putative protein phosphatase 2C 23 [Nymphaea thermarum]
MGNRFGKICGCCIVSGRRRGDVLAIGGSGGGPDEGLGHSFCYIRPDLARLSSSKVHHSEETTTFRSISGAALGANTSTPLSTDLCSYAAATAVSASAAFESSDSFQSIPLQPVPRFGGGGGGGGVFSGPIGVPPFSGPIERGFMSGPIERGFQSGPLDKAVFSGPLEKFQRSFSHGGMFAGRHRKASIIKALRRAITSAVARSSIVAPIKLGVSGFSKEKKSSSGGSGAVAENVSCDGGGGGGSELGTNDEDFSFESQNLQWAQGKAGEDRVHVVISEEHGWLFVGIYDGFNGPDAPDYLLSNLYTAVQMELKGLLWDQPPSLGGAQQNGCSSSVEEPNVYASDQNWTIGGYGNSENTEKKKNGMKRWKRRNSRSRFKGVTKKWEESQRRWKEQYGSSTATEGTVDHGRVLKALARALRKTEEDYLEIADKMLSENPELALMGSCVLVMLMKGEDVYLMNVGDSRGVLAQKVEADLWDLERINEETPTDLQFRDEDYSFSDNTPSLSALQLTLDHSTSVEERKWNDALLQMFQIDYIGTAPYLTCAPSLYHHRLGPRDRFLILSSDGLYQYFTNEEAVAEVETFIQSYPEGDPAQHLVEEVLFRAAKKAGMDFHELLEIPHGDRRRYHDDVSIIVVSLEGRIWRSCV